MQLVVSSYQFWIWVMAVVLGVSSFRFVQLALLLSVFELAHLLAVLDFPAFQEPIVLR